MDLWVKAALVAILAALAALMFTPPADAVSGIFFLVLAVLRLAWLVRAWRGRTLRGDLVTPHVKVGEALTGSCILAKPIGYRLIRAPGTATCFILRCRGGSRGPMLGLCVVAMRWLITSASASWARGPMS